MANLDCVFLLSLCHSLSLYLCVCLTFFSFFHFFFLVVVAVSWQICELKSWIVRYFQLFIRLINWSFNASNLFLKKKKKSTWKFINSRQFRIKFLRILSSIIFWRNVLPNKTFEINVRFTFFDSKINASETFEINVLYWDNLKWSVSV